VRTLIVTEFEERKVREAHTSVPAAPRLVRVNGSTRKLPTAANQGADSG